MKQTITLIFGIFFISQCFGQNQIELVFTSEYNSSFIPGDSILIENMTIGGDTMLYYPDTVLRINLTSLPDVAPPEGTNMMLSDSYPNPFFGTTSFNFNLPTEDHVIIQVSDASGSVVTKFSKHLSSGYHKFDLSAGTQSILFVTVITSSGKESTKLINQGTERSNVIKIRYSGMIKRSIFHNKSLQSGFICSIDDHLQFTGYCTQGTNIFHDIIADTLQNSGNYLFEYFMGIPCSGTPTVSDIDGNTYNTVQIGNQCWMVENLKVTKYPNGSSIPNVTDNTSWSNLTDNGTDDAYCYYNNNVNGEANTYGALYTWAAAMGDNAVSSSSNPSDVQGVCPNGWHLPSDDEWKELEMILGMSQAEAGATGDRGTNEGSKLAGNSLSWNSGNLENDAEFGTSGFSGLPAGYRSYDDGLFYPLGDGGYFWSATEGGSSSAWSRQLGYYSAGVYRGYYLKSFGFCVRCLQN